MKRFIDVVPMCDLCQGDLVITKIQIDLPNCCYIVHGECLLCGEEVIVILSLEDFIEINNLMEGDDNGYN